ncbi:LamG-like jellyroll fold domain-containing protein [Kitasatospora sp. NPDC049285]|uniref:LamG-like jellyroll fold domain-containing protein n=1 Tax=Kitasatospora sp. NPDC049285 TaxID=3157096 RepID=UPI003435E258
MFQNPDGTKTVRIYSRPVHYKKSDGSWDNIDTGLAQRRDRRWSETANGQDISFSPKADSTALLNWSVDAGHSLSYSLKGAQAATAVAKADTLTYPMAAQSTDVVYNTLASGIKESLVLHDASAPTTWVFPLTLNGLTATLDDAGDVQFTDETGQVRLKIPHGFMEDSAVDSHSGDGVISDGVAYHLTTVDGAPALEMDLDTAWLHDSHRVFPVKVDPSTSQINSTRTTYVSTQYPSNHSSENELRVGSYNGGTDSNVGYVVFDNIGTTLQNMYVEKAELDMDAIWGGGCSSRSVDVHPINGSWDPGSVTSASQVATSSSVIGTANFQAYNYNCSNSPSGPTWVPFDLGDDPTTAGVQYVNGWTHGGGNFGVALTADTGDVAAWKKFNSVNTSFPPYLKVTYVDWAATYSTDGTYNPPTYNTAGSQQLTMTNQGANWWDSTSMQVKPRFYDANWHEQFPASSPPLTAIPGSQTPVHSNQTVTFTATIPPIPPGQQYQLCWDGYVQGITSLSDSYRVPVSHCTWIQAANVAPQIDTASPLGGTVVGVLTPQYYASGHDPDNFPGTGLQYQFQVFPAAGSTPVADSGLQANTSWSVPSGLLAWNSSYYWIVRVTDGQASSAWSSPIPFSTKVQQPVITGQLGGAAGDVEGHTFNAQVGNYTTDATDAAVAAVGPALQVQRSYNSLDPRTSALFGAGWSSTWDMSVVPDADGTGSVLVTGASGREERFGRNDFQLTQMAGAGDQTGDGIDDAVAVDSTNGQLWLYPGPDFSASKRKMLGVGWWGLSHLTGADVTGDNVGDLLGVANSDGTLWEYKGVAGGGYSTKTAVASGFGSMTDLAITAPLAGGGGKDLVAVDSTTGLLWAYPFNSDGTLNTAGRASLGTGWNGITELIGGNFNSTGIGSLVGIQTGTGNLVQYQGTGNTTLGTSTLGNPTVLGTGWGGMRNLAPIRGVPGDSGTGVLTVAKDTGIQYLYHNNATQSGGAKTTTGMALYSSAQGEFETLATDTATAGGGWVLQDKTGTVYSFNQPTANSGFQLSKITDREKHTQVLHYNTSGKLDTVTDSTSARVLHLTWTADGRHVASVTTDPVSGTDPALTWTYSYNTNGTNNPDELDKVCAPPTGGNSTPSCTQYTSQAGSHLRSATLDLVPSSYWRLGEASGTTAASEVIANQGNDKGTYTNVGLGTAQGPLSPIASAAAPKAAAFNGTTSSVALPSGKLKNSYQSVALWFQTTSAGILMSYQNTALTAVPSHASPVLYVGADGLLRGELYSPTVGTHPITTTGTVTDGQWHLVVLSGQGASQTMYLDGAVVNQAPLAGQIDHLDQDSVFLGAGYATNLPWPSAPSAASDGNNHFNGQIAEAAVFDHGLGAPAVASLWQARQHASTELIKQTLPSGKTKLAVSYDAVNDRASIVTDAYQGNWTITPPTVSGSSQEYRSAVMGANPAGYWRLSDGQGTQAYNQVYVPRPTPNNGTYSNTTLGAAGPVAGSTAVSFNGTTSWAEVPASYAPQSGPGAIGVWFKTTTSGVLVGYEDAPIGATGASGQMWNPALYVGTDGYLYGQMWTGSANNSLKSATKVNNNIWHFALLSADSATSQTLYLDGQATAGPRTGAIIGQGTGHVYIGAGAAANWPMASTTDPWMHFNGQIADVAMFAHGLTSTTVSNLYTQATGAGASASAYDAAVVGAFPTGYWRLNDATGNTANELLSSAALAQNRGTYTNTTLGTTGPWASGTTTGASFNGTTSSTQLPANAVPKLGAGATVALWFKTSSPGVLYGYQDFPLGGSHTTSNVWNPALYVGSDHLLHGLLWTGGGVAPATSTAAVDDGRWHMAAISATGSSQQLYLDGQATGGAISGALKYNGASNAYLGAGNVDTWPSAPTDASGHLNGAIADFAIYQYALAAGTISTLYTTATTAGSTGGLDAASAYRAQVVDQHASAYWRLDDPAGSAYAADELGTALPDQTSSGTYTSTNLGTAGPSGDPNQGSATFNGTTSVLQLPSSAAPVKGPATMELWFKTTTAGVLYSYQSMPIGTAPVNGAGMSWNPALYVGTDSKLHGLFLDQPGSTSDQLTTSQTVTDGKWHQAVLAATAHSETLYLDGQQAGTENTGTISYNGTSYVYLGAGAVSSAWPAAPSDSSGHFNGSISEASYYETTLDAATVSAHFQAMGNASTPTAVTLATVTDPGGSKLKYRYDTRTGQLTSFTDATGNITSYTYDTSGFLHTVTDADGHAVTTGHDARGNAVSRTSCQNPASCQTSYSTYLLDTVNPYNPTNDKLATFSDARSLSPTDPAYTPTYTTTYAYSAAGDLTSVTTPATSDFTKGRTTYSTITAGTEQAVDSNGNPITGGTQPAGLTAAQSVTVDANAYPQATSLPAEQKTQYSYDTAGNLTKTVTPLGLTTTYTYDNLGRRTAKTETCANCGIGQTRMVSTTTYGWDGEGNPVSQKDPGTTDTVTSKSHTRQTTTTYDADGDPINETVADTAVGGDASRTTTWAYTANNDLLAQVTDPAGHKTSYTYDAFGRTKTETDAAGTTYNHVYSARGQLTQVAISNYTGDPNHPVSSRYQIIEARAYDPAGRLAMVTDAMGRTTHTYYNDDNTVAETDLDGFHSFNVSTQSFDGTTRDVVLQQNTYDPAGHLTQRVTGGGKTTVTNTFDAAGRTTSTTLDPGGLNRTTTYKYDAANNALSGVLTGGGDSRETDYTYDALGNPLSETVKNSPADSVTTHTYDQSGRLTTTVSPLGNVTGADPTAYTTSFTHDALGRLTTTTGPAIATTTFNMATGAPVTLPSANPFIRVGYGVFDNPTSVQDPNGNITTYTRTYDTAGEHDSAAKNSYTAPGQTTAVTAVTQIDYDAMGRVGTVHDAKGQVTKNTYDQLGNLVETDLPPVNTTTPKVISAYDLDGEKLSTTDPIGAQAQSTYDDLGRRITQTQLVRSTTGGATAAYTAAFGYDDAGNGITVITPGGAAATAAFDAAGERTSVTDPLNNTTSTSYNLAGQPTKTILPGSQPGATGPSATITYDHAGRVTSAAQLSTAGTTLATTSNVYDVAGNPTSATDADGNTTAADYYANGHVWHHTERVTADKSITTTFGYDAAGNRTAYTDGNGNTTYYTFNTLGLPESTIDPATSAYPNVADRAYTIGYDILGEPVTKNEPGGVTITSTYDPLGHLTNQTGTGGEAATPARALGYDLDGHLTSLSTPSGNQAYTYDDRGFTLTASGPLSHATYTYNPDGNLTSRSNEAGTTTFTYDPDGHLKTLAEPLTGTTLTYGYTPRGQVSTVQYGTGDIRSYTYDDQGNATADNLKTSTGATVSSLAYTYFPSGRLKTKTTTGLAGATTNTYTYDQAGRLATWNNGTTPTAYGYDGNGNLTANGINTATYNQRNQLTSNSLGASYTYTARGTRSAATTGGSTTSATYDAFDQLATQQAQSYTYDALGRLTTSNGHGFTYDTTTSSLTSDGTENYTRTPAGALTAVGTGTNAALAYTDRHGDLIATFTPTATTPSGSTAYDPWGKPLNTTGTNHNLGYQGGWTETTTGQINTASRRYDPATSGFTSRDTANLAPTTAAHANLYSYGAGDPLNTTDPTGHNPSCDPDTPPGDPQPQDTKWPGHNRYLDLGDDGFNYSAYFNMMSYGESSSGNEFMYELGHPHGGHLTAYNGYAWYPVSATEAELAEAEAADAQVISIFSLVSYLEEEDIALGEVAAYSGCDTDGPPPHRPAPPRPDPHKITPKPCVVCTTPAPPSGMNGPEAGPTNSGTPTTGTATPGGSPFQVGQVDSNQGLGFSPGFNGNLPDRDGCNTGAGFTGINKVYLPRKMQAGQCVAAGAFADLTPSDYTPPPRPKLGFALPGLTSLPDDNRARGHLIGYAMGGSNKDTRNFVPMYQEANQWMYDNAEDPVVEALKGGGSVFVEARPIYGNMASPVPTAIEYVTFGAVAERCIIMNNSTAAGSWCN